MPEILIDGAVPRTERERCVKLLDILRDHGGHEFAESFSFDMEGELVPGTGGEWHEVEEEILRAIGETIEGRIVVGEMCPGDVVLFTKSEMEV